MLLQLCSKKVIFQTNYGLNCDTFSGFLSSLKPLRTFAKTFTSFQHNNTSYNFLWVTETHPTHPGGDSSVTASWLWFVLGNKSFVSTSPHHQIIHISVLLIWSQCHISSGSAIKMTLNYLKIRLQLLLLLSQLFFPVVFSLHGSKFLLYIVLL